MFGQNNTVAQQPSIAAFHGLSKGYFTYAEHEGTLFPPSRARYSVYSLTTLLLLV